MTTKVYHYTRAYMTKSGPKMGPQTCTKILKGGQVGRPRVLITPETKQLILKMFQENNKYKTICETTGFSYYRVRKVIQDNILLAIDS